MEYSMINFAIKTYGCKVNLYNSQLLLENLLNSGRFEHQPEKPIDLLFINACVVTKHAEREIIRFCNKNLRQNQGIKIIAFGCLSVELKEDLVKIGIFCKNYAEILKDLIIDEGSSFKFLTSISTFQDRTRAFVKVQNGCNQFCSYCIVPMVRGKLGSRSVREIKEEVKQIIAAGYKEIVLTGTQIGLFQEEGNPANTLLSLMKELKTDFNKDLARIRISSIGPTFISNDMIDFLAVSPLFCNHMHISLQSGSDRILQKMNRRYNTQFFLEMAAKLKKARKDFCLSTDIIVGFPGETEEDFLASIALSKEVNFSKIHVFPFSPRSGTLAYQYKNIVQPEVIKKRTKDLLELSKTLSYNVKQDFIGKSVEVLIEEDSSGFTTNYLRVVLRNGCNRKGQLAFVSVGTCDADALYESNLT
jgi:threonylcarbamoyladenosine tRNA methylthiotransferase MtaB